MGIVTPPMRKAIKVLMVKKYIDQCGIKMPKVPTLPEFEPPPMPDLSMIEEQIQKLRELAEGLDAESIYTPEYIEATKEYNETIQNADDRRKGELARIKQEYISESNTDMENILMETDPNSEYNIQSDAIEKEYWDTVGKAREKLDGVTKFKRIADKEKRKANKAAEKDTESKKGKVKAEALEFIKEVILARYTEWIKKEGAKIKRIIDETVEMYQDTVALFNKVKDEAKAYFQDGGPGDAFVEDECDKIDRIFDNFKESFTELGTDIGTLVAKIPNPDVIVAGAATGVPNPGQKVMIFMENMKKVLTDIKKIANYIKEILAIAKAIGFAIKDLIPAFKKLCEAFEAKQKDAESAFKDGVKAIRKKQKWYLKHEHPKDEENTDETKLAGYMYADAEVDWVNHDIKIKGYKCYCRKDYARKYSEDGITKKSMWIGGYRKNSGPYTDSSGKHYYYIPEDEISGATEYDENDILEELERDGEDYDVDLGTSYDPVTNTTKLSLSDGRTVVIDYLAASGDIIRLDDGTIIRVK